MRYLLDSDAVPDKCTDPIWLLGVHHPGYEPPPPAPPSPGAEKKRRSSASPPVSFRSSTSSTTFPESPLSQSTSSLAVSSGKSTNANNKLDPSANWPPAFYHDFTSRVWLTYRSQFSIPIRDMRLGDLSTTDNWEGVACPPGPGSPVSAGKRSWPWGGGEKTWNSDSGWGCMLRTGQSLLANALVYTHLGRGLSHACSYMRFF
jgi:cysteine protease ATG4